MQPARRFFAIAFGCSVLLVGAGAVSAQTPAEWHAAQVVAAGQSEQIMHAAEARKGLLAQYEYMLQAYFTGSRSRAFRIIFGQYLSWYQTWIGDYPNAEASFAIQESLQPGDSPNPLLGGYHAKPAIEAIAQLAKGRRAVFFNEAHNLPVTRTLTVQMLQKLRAEGFDTFAAETLYHSDSSLHKRGYPTADTGFYTNEPICAEMVRTALKLGFRVVAYEAESEARGDARETEQAKNLYERVFKQDPDARMVVDAGYAHIQESGVYLGGSSMAEHFAKISGIDPLTVEQTMLIAHHAGGSDHPWYAAVMQQLQPDSPVVFVDKDGKPWSLRAGYDVSVFMPPGELRRGRPTWLALGGLRKPWYVSGDITCKDHFPCLVEARYINEGNEAIPADRMLFDPEPALTTQHRSLRPMHGASFGELYLRPGKYRLSMTDADGRVLSRQVISVP